VEINGFQGFYSTGEMVNINVYFKNEEYFANQIQNSLSVTNPNVEFIG